MNLNAEVVLDKNHFSYNSSPLFGYNTFIDIDFPSVESVNNFYVNNQSEEPLYQNYTNNSSVISTFLACTTAMEINALFSFLSVTLMFISVLASVLDLLFFMAVCVTKSMPVNVRIILANLASACFLLSLSLIFQSILNLVIQSVQFPPVSIYRCSWLQSIRIISGSAVSSFMLVMALERVIISRRAVSGVNQTKLAWTVVALTILSWLWSLINVLVALWQNYIISSTQLCFCDSTLLGFPFFSFVTYLEVFVPLEVLVVLLFWAFWLYYRKRLRIRGMNTAQHNLSERVTIMDVIFTTNVLLPTITLHVACIICFAACTTVGHRWNDYTYGLPWGIVFIQLGQLFIACYCLLFPAICFRLNAALSKSFYSLGYLANIYEFLTNAELWSTNRKQRKYVIEDPAPPSTPRSSHFRQDNINLERIPNEEQPNYSSNAQSDFPRFEPKQGEYDSVTSNGVTVYADQPSLIRNNVIFVKPQTDE